MGPRTNAFISPKLEAYPLPDKGGYGVYARESIAQGELLVVWGGVVMDWGEFQQLPAWTRHYSIQVEEDLYLVTLQPAEPADCIDHCCSPNAGMSGQIALIARRDISPGEEICYDYAMSDGSPYDEFDCQCGSPDCRGRITGEDWQRPDLQEKYEGFFSPYLQRRIDRLKAARGEIPQRLKTA
jgi:hypothetical protein